MPGDGIGRHQLIHVAAGDADEIILGTLGDQGEIGRRQHMAVSAGKGPAEGDTERRRRRQASPLRHVAADGDVGPAQRQPAALKLGMDAADMIGPFEIFAVADGRVEGKRVAGIAVIGSDDRHLGTVPRADCHRRRMVDGAGQHEAVVIIGVLADQIDPARRANQQIGLAVKRATKGGGNALGFGIYHGVPRSIEAARSGVRSRCASASIS